MANRIMVSICCITYNQKKYIKSALDSFLRQKTNFDYEIIVHDDASDDGTIDIIKKYEKKYPNRIVTIFESENQYSKRPNSVLDIVFAKAKGKYIALCDGDDGFYDDNKLQMQFDVLEGDKSISLVSHNTRVVSSDEVFVSNNVPYSKNVITEEDFLMNYSGSMHTSSMMFRRCDVVKLPCYFKDALVGDLPLKLYLLSIGNGFHIDKIMSFYRTNAIGSWSLMEKVDKNRLMNNFIKEIEVYELFNRDTDYRYDRYVCDRILYRKFNFYKDNGNLKEIKKKEYCDLYKKLSVREKIKLYLKSNKFIYGVYGKVKYGKRC